MQSEIAPPMQVEEHIELHTHYLSVKSVSFAHFPTSSQLLFSTHSLSSKNFNEDSLHLRQYV